MKQLLGVGGTDDRECRAGEQTTRTLRDVVCRTIVGHAAAISGHRLTGLVSVLEPSDEQVDTQPGSVHRLAEQVYGIQKPRSVRSRCHAVGRRSGRVVGVPDGNCSLCNLEGGDVVL